VLVLQDRNTASVLSKSVLHKKGLASLKNGRPVALLCTDYKIFSRALANRLKEVIESITHRDQSYGIPDRTIMDNIFFHSQEPASVAEDQTTKVSAFGCYPARIAPDPLGPSHGWLACRKGDPRHVFGLCPTECRTP